MKVLIFFTKISLTECASFNVKIIKKQIFEYYLGKFRRINMGTIGRDVRNINEVLYRYWKIISDFK